MIKNLLANVTRFSEGDAAYFYDFLSPILEKTYAKESGITFSAFHDKNAPIVIMMDQNKDEKDINLDNVDKEDSKEQIKKEEEEMKIEKIKENEAEKESKYVDLKALKEGMEEYEWDSNEYTPEEYIAMFTPDLGRDKLYLREFFFF